MHFFGRTRSGGAAHGDTVRQRDYYNSPVTERRRGQEAELEAPCRQITQEDPGCFDRLADRVLAEFKAEGWYSCGKTAWDASRRRKLKIQRSEPYCL